MSDKQRCTFMLHILSKLRNFNMLKTTPLWSMIFILQTDTSFNFSRLLLMLFCVGNFSVVGSCFQPALHLHYTGVVTTACVFMWVHYKTRNWNRNIFRNSTSYRTSILMAFRRTNSSVYPNPGGAVIDVTFEPNTVTNINK